MGRTIIPLDLAKSYAKDGSSSQFGDRKVGEGIENCEGSKCCEDFCATNFLPGNSENQCMAPKGNDARWFLIMPSTWALQETTNVPRNSESNQLLIHAKWVLPESKNICEC